MAAKKNRLAINTILTLVGIGIGVFGSATAWQKLRDQRAMTDDARKVANEAESTRADLLRKQSMVDTDAGRETVARDRGFKGQNEIPIEPK